MCCMNSLIINDPYYPLYTVVVSVRNGFPVLSLPLPSRRENCEFVMRPYLQSVGDFLTQLSNEDNGIDK